MATERMRFYFAIKTGALANLRATLKDDPLLDPLGGADQIFDILLNHAGGGAQWGNGGSLVAPISAGHNPGLVASGPNDWKDWLNADPEDLIFGPDGMLNAVDASESGPTPMNTGEANVQFMIWAAYETGILGSGSPGQQFDAALGGAGNRGPALERVVG